MVFSVNSSASRTYCLQLATMQFVLMPAMWFSLVIGVLIVTTIALPHCKSLISHYSLPSNTSSDRLPPKMRREIFNDETELRRIIYAIATHDDGQYIPMHFLEKGSHLTWTSAFFRCHPSWGRRRRSLFPPQCDRTRLEKLNDHQIQLSIDDILGRDDHMTEVYNSVNGQDVDEKQLANPGEHLWPLNFHKPISTAIISVEGTPRKHWLINITTLQRSHPPLTMPLKAFRRLIRIV